MTEILGKTMAVWIFALPPAASDIVHWFPKDTRSARSFPPEAASHRRPHNQHKNGVVHRLDATRGKCHAPAEALARTQSGKGTAVSATKQQEQQANTSSIISSPTASIPCSGLPGVQTYPLFDGLAKSSNTRFAPSQRATNRRRPTWHSATRNPPANRPCTLLFRAPASSTPARRYARHIGVNAPIMCVTGQGPLRVSRS